MEASNGLEFLPLLAVLGLLGLKISWFPIRIGETYVATNIGLWQLALDLVAEEEAYLGEARYLSVPITFPVVRKMCEQGRTVSMTFACVRDVWRGLELSSATSTSVVTSRIMGQTIAWLVGLMNKFCVEILLVVSVAEIPLAVYVATLGSLFRSLPSTIIFS